MLELFALFVIGAGFLGMRHNGRWEWSRAQARGALAGMADRAFRLADRGMRAAPGAVVQCLRDVRELGNDLVILLPGGARRRLEGGKIDRFLREGVDPERIHRAFPAQGADPGAAAAGSPSRTAVSGALRKLQARYVEGSITLDQYRQEAERLRRATHPRPA